MMNNEKENSQTAYENEQRDDTKLSVLASCLFDGFLYNVDHIN